MLRIWREGNEQELRATLGELISVERTQQTEQEVSPESRSNTGKLGLAVQPLTPALTQELGLPVQTQGLVVVAIDPIGPAADAGIQRGDVIEQVNQQPVRTVAELRDSVQRSGTAPLLLLVNQRGTTIFVTMKAR
jgi:serine protease Do